jgi:hypothetical protein
MLAGRSPGNTWRAHLTSLAGLAMSLKGTGMPGMMGDREDGVEEETQTEVGGGNRQVGSETATIINLKLKKMVREMFCNGAVGQ